MENNNSIFVQAKIEYTKQLVNTLKSPIYDGIKSIYEDAKEIYKSNSSTSLLYIFRTLLEKIPEWNNELIINETDRIIRLSFENEYSSPHNVCWFIMKKSAGVLF